MAWLANPFAYVAINTVVAIVPSLGRKLDLSPAMAGFFCSIWFFARLGTFLVLWLWTGWHYRMRWFLGAYLLLVGSFAALLLVPKLLVWSFAQVTFGLALGFFYYSSLYYSMDVGEAKGEHGGFMRLRLARASLRVRPLAQRRRISCPNIPIAAPSRSAWPCAAGWWVCWPWPGIGGESGNWRVRTPQWSGLDNRRPSGHSLPRLRKAIDYVFTRRKARARVRRRQQTVDRLGHRPGLGTRRARARPSLTRATGSKKTSRNWPALSAPTPS